MSTEFNCQPSKLDFKINGGKQLQNKIIELIAEKTGIAKSEVEGAEEMLEALCEAISSEVARGVTSYLNTLTPIVVGKTPQGDWDPEKLSFTADPNPEYGGIFSDGSTEEDKENS